MTPEPALDGLDIAAAIARFDGGRVDVASADGVVAATFRLASPAFSPPSGGVAVLAGVLTAPVLADAVLAAGRAYAADGTPLARLAVGRGGDLDFGDPAVYRGGTARIAGLRYPGGPAGTATYRPVVYVRRDSPTPGDVAIPIGYIEGLSTPFRLIGCDLTGRFHAGVPDGGGWSVATVARPRLDVGEVVAALDQVGEDAMAELFGTSPAGVDRVLADTWRGDAPTPDRLAAVLLALGRRMEELRTGRGG